MTRTFLLIAAFFLCFGSPANVLWATDYFVSGTGNDANDGLSAGTALRTLSQACTMAAAGDRIVVEAGTYSVASGETFPVTLPNGVNLDGPGDGTAIVDSTGSAMSTFDVGSLGTTTILEGLNITTDNTAIAIELSGVPADLQVMNNTITGAALGVGATTPVTAGILGLTVQSNSMTVGDGIQWWAMFGAGTHNAVVTDNTIIATNSGVTFTAFTDGALDATIQRNSLMGGAWNGIFTCALCATGNATITATIEENTVQSFANFGIFGTAQVQGGNCSNTQVIRSNTILNTGGTGLWGFASGGSSGTGAYNGTIECNTIVNTTGNGAWFGAKGSFLASNQFDAVIESNLISGGTTHGMVLDVYATSLAYARATPVLRGNVITGNRRSGLVLAFSASASASGTLNPDLGDFAGAGPGKNTFAGNDLAAVAAPELDASDYQLNSVTIPAQGNWWGPSSSAGIEGEVRHQPDDPNFPTVDYSGFLQNPLVLSTNDSWDGMAGGVPLTIVADATSPFIAKAGSQMLAATIGGLPVANPVVSSGGLSLSFTTPTGVSGVGEVRLVVTNPGGQTGTLSFSVPLEGSGFCFVATAAFGDDESPEVRVLRRWRDEHLAGNGVGRQLVKAYYALSPGLAEAISDSPAARTATRAALAPVVGAAKLWMDLPWAYAVAGLALAWRVLRKRR